MTASKDSLASFIDDVCPQSHLRVEADLGDGFVRLRSDEAERRQAAHDIRSTEDIIIELLRNSRDAGAKHIFLATTTEGPTRKIVVIDDGVGVPDGLTTLIFEPRVTSKLDTMHMDKWGVHGRGMALYSVSVNATRAEVVKTRCGLGTAIAIETDTCKLKEKADQSSFPTISIADGSKAVIRGPHNINRTVAEFALEHRSSLSVYLGSPAAIAATMYLLGRSTIPASTRTFSCVSEGIPLYKRLCFAQDDKGLARLCAEFGLDMSARTARRIMDGQIVALEPLAEMMERRIIRDSAFGTVEEKQERTPKGVSKEPDDPRVVQVGNASPKIGKAQLDVLAEATQEAFKEIAEAYYLDPTVNVEAKVSHGVLKLTIPLICVD